MKKPMMIAFSMITAGLILYGIGLLLEHQRVTPITLEVLNTRLSWLLFTMIVGYMILLTWIHKAIMRLINLKHDLAMQIHDVEREILYMKCQLTEIMK